MSAVLASLCGILFFTNLGYPLIKPDETRYAQISLEIYESGNWVVPTLHGEPYLDKPPLLYWLISGSYSLFGPSPWSARLPVAISAMLTVLATYMLGRRLIGDRAAWIAGLALFLSAGFVLTARFLIMDGLLTLLTTVGLLAAANALRGPPRALWWWATAGIACGLGILVKGPISVVICVPPILAIHWLTGRRGFRHRDWIAFLLPCMLIAVPWFCLVMVRQPEFAGHFFWQHHIIRFWNAFNHQEPGWFYLPVLAIGMFPTSLLLPALAYYLFARNSRHLRHRTPELGFLVASGSWTVLFFSLSGCKLPTYILPALPMICLAIGKMGDDTSGSLVQNTFFRRYNVRASQLVTAVTSFVGVVLGIGGLVFGSPDLVLATMVFVIVSSSLLLTLFARQRRARSIRSPWLGAVSVCLVVGMFGFSYILPEFASWRSRSYHAAQLLHKIGNDAPVVFFGVPHDAAQLEITQAPIIELSHSQINELVSLASQYSRVVLVTNLTTAQEIRAYAPALLTVQPSPSRSDVYEAKANTALAVRIGARAFPKER